MGVKHLWSILESACQHGSIDDLAGKTVAVDLSIWIIESRSVASNHHRNALHLRTLFFRVLNLIYFNIKPIFVLDAPRMIDLKFNALAKRDPSINGTRSQFNHLINECSQLLTYLGLPILRAEGEAEKLCAQLNRMKIVDLVISNDSDCFVYGAQSVIRNFSIDTKSITFDRYDRDEIESICQLTGRDLILLALLLGSDYDRRGLTGIGREYALKYLRRIPKDQDSVKYFLNTLNRPKVENKIEEKIFHLLEENPSIFKEFDRIVEEYSSIDKETLPPIQWLKPVRLKELQKFMKKKLSWIESYTFQKVFPLLTRFQILYRLNLIDLEVNEVLSLSDLIVYQAEKIDKVRVRQGKEFYQVKWKCPTADLEDQMANLSLIVVDENDDEEEKLITVEPADLFRHAYPELVQKFEEPKSKKKLRNEKKKTKPSANHSTSMSLDLLSMIVEEPKKFHHRPTISALSTSMNLDVLSVIQKSTENPSSNIPRAPVDLCNTSLSIDLLEILIKENRNPSTSSDPVLPLPLWERIRQRSAV